MQRKPINPSAYIALAEALTVIFWNKRPFERYLRGMLKDHGELLLGLDFKGVTKRETAGQVVEQLQTNEHRFLDLITVLMLDIASMESFPNLRQQVDSVVLLAKAEAAVAEVRKWAKKQDGILREHEDQAREMAEAGKRDTEARIFTSVHDDLRERFFAMHSATDPHKRGTSLEQFINELFGLYDLEPRASYSLDCEQIDGAFTFNTHDYILEAKWWKEPVGRPLLDIFKTNIERKAKNTLGLYVSVNGFTGDAISVYGYGTPFITMEGMDFMAVLDRRIRLDELIQHKKRHASETGQCYYPVTAILGR